jgi:hypothetical protein
VHLGRVHLTLHNNNQEHEKHESMRIVLEGWNQVPSDIKNARTVGSLKIIELHWRLQRDGKGSEFKMEAGEHWKQTLPERYQQGNIGSSSTNKQEISAETYCI